MKQQFHWHSRVMDRETSKQWKKNDNNSNNTTPTLMTQNYFWNLLPFDASLYMCSFAYRGVEERWYQRQESQVEINIGSTKTIKWKLIVCRSVDYANRLDSRTTGWATKQIKYISKRTLHRKYMYTSERWRAKCAKDRICMDIVHTAQPCSALNGLLATKTIPSWRQRRHIHSIILSNKTEQIRP